MRVATLTEDQQAEIREQILSDINAAHAVEFRTEYTGDNGGEVFVYPSIDHEIQHIEQALPDYLQPLGSDGFGNLRCHLSSTNTE